MKNPRVTMASIERAGGIVVCLPDGYATAGGRRLRADSVRHLIRSGRLVSGRDGMIGDKPQTYRTIEVDTRDRVATLATDKQPTPETLQ